MWLLNDLQELFDGSFKNEWCRNKNLEVKMKSNTKQDKIQLPFNLRELKLDLAA